MKFCQRGLEGSPLLLAEWKCVPDDSLSCFSNPELRRKAPWTNFSSEILQFLSLRNFCPGGRILLFNTSFGNLRTRAFILDHKKGVFKHFKGLKNADAATADLIRVVLAEILDFICIRSQAFRRFPHHFGSRQTCLKWPQSVPGHSLSWLWATWNTFQLSCLASEGKCMRYGKNASWKDGVQRALEGSHLD